MKNKWSKSFFRFLFFQIILLVSLILSCAFFGAYSKNSQAQLLGSSLRNSFLVGDNRSLITSLGSSLENGYFFINAYDLKGNEILKIGSEEKTASVFSMSHSFEILSNTSLPESGVGKIVFHYSLFLFVRNGFLVWIICTIVSSPFLIFEKKRLEALHNVEMRNLELETAKKITEQVSHDIRSPLAVLKNVVDDISGLSSEDSLLIKRAVKRIDDIASDVLNKNPHDQTLVETVSLNFLLKSILEEKAIQFKKKKNVILKYKDNDEVNIQVNLVEFYRLISNLINNSYEAMDEFGLIEVYFEIFPSSVVLKIKDNGKGIAQDFLEKIGERGLSNKKSNSAGGTGLGLYHAKRTIEAWNGVFRVDSELNIGTVISMELPIISILSRPVVYEYVYIENDELLRLVWEQKSKKSGVKILLLSSPLEFEAYSNEISKDFSQIYIDSDFGEGIIKGEDFAAKLHDIGFKNLFLCTGYAPERFSHMPWLKHVGKKCPL